MKKPMILLFTLITFCYADAQNPPLVEKAAPKSNAALPSNGTLGSNSGVNPAGNPGTIVSYSGNSNSINTKVTPNPNIEPGVFLSSSPEGAVTTTTVVNNSNVERSSTVTVNGSTVTATTQSQGQPIKEEVAHAAPQPNPNPPASTSTTMPPTAPVANSGMTVTTEKSKSLPAYSPLLSNYIPEEVIKKIKSKFGGTVYDIKTVRLVKTNQIAYLVRLSENGVFRNEIFYNEP